MWLVIVYVLGCKNFIEPVAVLTVALFTPVFLNWKWVYNLYGISPHWNDHRCECRRRWCSCYNRYWEKEGLPIPMGLSSIRQAITEEKERVCACVRVWKRERESESESSKSSDIKISEWAEFEWGKKCVNRSLLKNPIGWNILVGFETKMAAMSNKMKSRRYNIQ